MRQTELQCPMWAVKAGYSQRRRRYNCLNSGKLTYRHGCPWKKECAQNRQKRQKNQEKRSVARTDLVFWKGARRAGGGGSRGRGPTGWKQELRGGRGGPGREMKGREGSWYAGCGAGLSGRPQADRPRKLNAGGRGAGAALGAGRGPAIITLHISGSNGKSYRNPDKPRAPISRLTNVSASQKPALAPASLQRVSKTR